MWLAARRPGKDRSCQAGWPAERAATTGWAVGPGEERDEAPVDEGWPGRRVRLAGINSGTATSKPALNKQKCERKFCNSSRFITQLNIQNFLYLYSNDDTPAAADMALSIPNFPAVIVFRIKRREKHSESSGGTSTRYARDKIYYDVGCLLRENPSTQVLRPLVLCDVS
jgi:hypothetical protein